MKAFKASIVRAAVAEGRTPDEDWMRIKKDLEIYDTLSQFRRAGLQFVYHSCDISDWDALGKTLDSIRSADGPITGILHGAGYAKPARFEQKSRDSLERTVAAKVDGAVALMALTERDPLRWFVGFGSLSGRFGGNGLSDYAAANDMLAKVIEAFRRRRSQCAATCIHWQTWDEVGMATLADGVAITKNVLQMAFIPPQEGIEHLRQELCLGLPRPEIVVTDGHFQRTFYPDQQPIVAGDSVSQAVSASQGAEQIIQPIAQPSSASRVRPLVESVVRGEQGALTISLRLDPTADPFLLEHRLRTKPFLPAVIGWEALAEAASLDAAGRTVVALCDVEITNGMLFHGPEPICAQVSVTATANGVACALTSRQCDRKGRLIDAQRLHVRAMAELADAPLTIEAAPPGQPPLGWLENQYPEHGLMYHGTPLRCLKQWAFQYDGGWARIVAPSLAELAGPRPAAGWILPPAVLDACLYACGSFVFVQFGGQLEVPEGLKRLVWTRQPKAGESCVLRFSFLGRAPRHSRFDFTLFGEDQQPLLQASEFRTVRVIPGG